MKFIKKIWQHRKEIGTVFADIGKTLWRDPLGLGSDDPAIQEISSVLFILMVALCLAAMMIAESGV